MTQSDDVRGDVAAALEGMCDGGALSVHAANSTASRYGASPRRLRQWQAIFDEILAGQDVPREGRALVVTAGPPGAGKSTALMEVMDGDLSHWRRLDPDDIKERLIRLALVEGLYEELLRTCLPDGLPIMPLELAGLVHRESVQMVADLRRICMSRGENVILEGTLSWEPMIDVHLREINEHNYDALDVLVVDVPLAQASEQSLTRWWKGRTERNSELGGRFVPRSAIEACYGADQRSICRTNGEELRRRAVRQGVPSVRLVEPDEVSKSHLRVIGEH